MTRKLAHIEVITNIQPIPNADAIQVATILGWKCVVKKDEFKVGDKVIYVEVDSILPSDNPHFEFMKERKYRVRTIKLRGQISQGIVFPLSVLPKNSIFNVVGKDVTQELKIEKYDPQIQEENLQFSEYKNPLVRFAIKKLSRFSWFRKLIQRPRGGFPSWIRKTDEERVQNMPYILAEEYLTSFIVTEKLDGQSVTYFLKKNKATFLGKEYEFGVCSRNLRIKTPDNSSYWSIARTQNIEKVLTNLAETFKANTVVLQGEIIGQGIQKNKYGILGYRLFAYNLIIDGNKIPYEDMRFAMNVSGESIDCVPLLYESYLLPQTMDELITFSTGLSTLFTSKPIAREGLVLRNYEKDISFKVINPEFLLKYSE